MSDGSEQKKDDLLADIQGYYIDDLQVGMRASFAKTVSEADISAFAGISGDFNPIHINKEFGEASRFKGCIAHGMLSAAFISTVLGTRLPGPGAIYMKQQLQFTAPVRAGDTVTAVAEVAAVDQEKQRCTLTTRCLVGGEEVLVGEATMWVPRKS